MNKVSIIKSFTNLGQRDAGPLSELGGCSAKFFFIKNIEFSQLNVKISISYALCTIKVSFPENIYFFLLKPDFFPPIHALTILN